MLIREIRALSTPEVEAKLDDAHEELFKLRFQFKAGQLTDYSRLSATRRTIARLETVVREREIAAELAVAKEN